MRGCLFCFVDLLGDCHRKFQSLLGGFAGDDGGLASLHALNEAFQFQFERLFFFDGNRLADNAAAGKLADDASFPALCGQQLAKEGRFFFVFARHAAEIAFLFSVVQRDVAGRLAVAEHADFSHLIKADPAGGKVGDASVLEANSGVGDVFGRAQNGKADAFHRNGGRPHKGKHDVQIMNHEIQNDADVRAASGKGGKPMSFDETRLGGFFLEVAEDRIKSFDVADLKNLAPFPAEGNQFGGLGRRLGHRFFDEDVFVLLQEIFGDAEVS